MGVRAYSIFYHPLVTHEDIPRLDKSWREAVETAIEAKLTIQPDLFGAPLRQSLRGHRKLRVGDYRVIYRIEKEVVRVLIIGHRSDVYAKAEMRHEVKV